MKQEEYIQGKWYYGEVFQEVYGIFRHSHNSKYSPHYSESYLENGNTLGAHFMASYDSIATPSQIETCLKAYAEKNGYVDDAKIICCDEKFTIEGGLYYHECIDCLAVTSNGAGAWVYREGQWAEIVAHAPSVQDKQDEALTESIHEYLTNQDLEKMSVLINGHSVSLLKCVEVYQLCLGIKTIIG